MAGIFRLGAVLQNMLKKTALLLALLPVFAQAQVNTMRDAAQEAINSNPDVQAKWHAFLAANGERDVAAGAYLPHLDAQNARRAAIAAAYDAALADGDLRPPARRADTTHVFHLYVVRAPGRAALQARLRARGIGTAIHFPVPVHLQAAYKDRVALGPARCAATEAASDEVLSLPIFPEMTDLQVEAVCEALRA